MKIKARLS